MNVEPKDKNILIERFPEIELSYDQINHNKVSYYDICIAIPQGRKCFLWFTYLFEKNVCLLLELNKRNEIEDIKIELCQFNSELSLGTILYGTTLFYGNKFFCCEDIFYYKGEQYTKTNYKNKLNLFNIIFNYEINQKVYTRNELIVALPIIMNDKNKLIEQLKYLPYKIYHIQYRSFKNNRAFNSIYNQNRIKSPKLIFKVKPRVKSDIYELFCFSHSGFVFYDTAFIPDYKTSVYMNKIFRNIKENNNLDYLEESDDEEEFQDIREDKFVYLNKEVNIICEYNYRFKKWIPLKITKDRKITNKKDIRNSIIQKS